MTTVQVVAPGSTPTGVGLVLVARADGNYFRFTTQCCNALFVNRGQSAEDPDWSISAWCSVCDTEYTRLMFKCGAVLYHDTSKLERLDGDLDWLANGLGYDRETEDFQVTVE